jgi:hypothetical protein
MGKAKVWHTPCYDGWMISLHMMAQESIGEICTLWPIVLWKEKGGQQVFFLAGYGSQVY